MTAKITASKTGLFMRCRASLVEDQPENDPEKRTRSKNIKAGRGQDIHEIIHYGFIFGREGFLERAEMYGLRDTVESLKVWDKMQAIVRLFDLLVERHAHPYHWMHVKQAFLEERFGTGFVTGQCDLVMQSELVRMVVDYKTGYHPDLATDESYQLITIDEIMTDWRPHTYGVIYHVDTGAISVRPLDPDGKPVGKAVADDYDRTENPGPWCLRCEKNAKCRTSMLQNIKACTTLLKTPLDTP